MQQDHERTDRLREDPPAKLLGKLTLPDRILFRRHLKLRDPRTFGVFLAYSHVLRAIVILCTSVGRRRDPCGSSGSLARRTASSASRRANHAVQRPRRAVMEPLRHERLHRRDVLANLAVVLVLVDSPRGA